MNIFTVYQQLAPRKDKRTQNWYSVLFPVGDVIAKNSHGALALAKLTYNLRCPIVKQV